MRFLRDWLAFGLIALAGLAPSTNQAAAVRDFSVRVAPGVDVGITAYGNAPGRLILWLPSEVGIVGADHAIAKQLADAGYTVWLADLFGARFLPVLPSSLAQIPAQDVAALIAAGHRQYARIYLLASSHGAGRALEGAQLWQQQNPGMALAGAVLLYPNLFAGSPEAGEAPHYLPVAHQLRLPLAIVQGELSPWFWQLDGLRAELRRGGERLIIQTLPGVRDRFYFREDATARERAAAQTLATRILDHLRALAQTKTREAAH